MDSNHLIVLSKEKWFVHKDTFLYGPHIVNDKRVYFKFYRTKYVKRQRNREIIFKSYKFTKKQFVNILEVISDQEVIFKFVKSNTRRREDILFEKRLYRILTKDGKILFEDELASAIVNNTIKFVLPKEKVKTVDVGKSEETNDVSKV